MEKQGSGRQCDCEHMLHFPAQEGEQPLQHAYGRDAAATVSVKTEYGTFHICDKCYYDTHWLVK